MNDRAGKPTTGVAPMTGQTIFEDRPLRFRSMTIAAPDIRAFESPDESAFKIRLAKRSGTIREARTMVERGYSRRGYRVPGHDRDPNLFTFLAYDEGRVVGTVGIRLDSAQGLSADELYRGEIDHLRESGSKLCEFTCLALDAESASKPILAGLFHVAYLYASVVKGCTHAVIEVNPRHTAYYVKALKFDLLGPERLNRRVNAPAVLLCVRFSVIAEGTAKFAGRPDAPGANHSLFQHGLPPDDETAVLERLRRFVSSGGP